MSLPSERPSVLIVEDERIVARDLQQTLSDLGYDSFAIASSAQEALAFASERCPDIVLMDIQIKGDLDGIQTAEILKKQFDIPVVYLTAHADEATLERAKMTEPHGYLVKPIKLAELRSCLEVSLFKHRMERSLRERERWFSTTLRSIADAVVAVDANCKVTFLNPAAEALIGLPAARCIGRPAREVLRLTNESSVEIGETPVEKALRLNQPIELHRATLLNLSTGAHRLIDNISSPVTDEQLPLGAVMVFRDVTERTKMQKRLEFAERISSLGTMAAGAADELNSPLTVVIGNADFVAEGLKQYRADLNTGAPIQRPDQRLVEALGALADLRSAARRMARIITDLQAFSRPDLETHELVNLARCIEWAVHATAHEFRDRGSLLTRLGVVPAVSANETRLEQVLINLLLNAAQSIPAGASDRNEVIVATSTDDSGRAVIEIRDTGAGIPADALPRIFDPFFTTKEIATSPGLGLWICHGIVSSFGGEITVQSEVGKGTTIRVLLPPASPQAVSAETTTTPKPQESKAQESKPAEPVEAANVTAGPLRARVLVIDDKKTLLQIMRRTLQRDNHDVLCTENAREALAFIERGEVFDVVFCDLMMPNMNGIEFYRTILDRNPALAARIVFLTGGATTAKAGVFLRSIPNLLVEKPFEPKALLEMVQQFLKGPVPAKPHPPINELNLA